MGLRTFLDRILRHVPGASPEKTEADVAADPARVDSRATGGDPDRRPTEGGTTGTTVAQEFVGRVAGDDHFAGETGAEVRARHRRPTTPT